MTVAAEAIRRASIKAQLP